MNFKIAIIGTGNLAWHLAPALENAGHILTEIYGRNLFRAEKLTARLYATEAQDHLDFSDSEAEFFIMAVSDTAIAEISDAIILPEGSILLHTSGSMPLEILNYSSSSYTGVFYPLQSFSKSRKIDFGEVPILLESEDSRVLNKIKDLARSLSTLQYILKSKDRKALHVAAVFASNFTNHMIRIAEEVMQRQGLDFEMIKPLVIEQISKTLAIGAKAAQTGPAVREDIPTLEMHHRFLYFNEQVAEIYRLISQDIIDSQE